MKPIKNRIAALEQVTQRRQRQATPPRWGPRPKTLAAWKLGIAVDKEIADLGLEGGAVDDPDALRWTVLEERYNAAGLDEDAEQVAAYRQELKRYNPKS